MTDKDQKVFMAKLAEQAERYEGKKRVFSFVGMRVGVKNFEFVLSRQFGYVGKQLSGHKIFNGQSGCIDRIFSIITLALPSVAYIYRIEVL